MTDTHNPECPCNNADDRGCFLISANTNKCVSCTCEKKDNNSFKFAEK